MIKYYNLRITTLLKVYVAIALLAAAVSSPLALSIIPAILLGWYLYLWRWPLTPTIKLLTEYFMFFALVLLFSLSLGPFFCLLIPLPVLILIHQALEETADTAIYEKTTHARRPTRICQTLLIILVVLLIISLLFGSLPLLFGCLIITASLAGVGTTILKNMSPVPVTYNQVQIKVLAGGRGSVHFALSAKAGPVGWLFIESPYPWLKVSPNVISLRQPHAQVEITLTPALSGPSLISLHGYAIDRWGLIQTRFEMVPLRLFVIPKARYAAWLARKYFAGLRPGNLPIVSNLSTLKLSQNLRRGVEYYGSQLYQPGNNLKHIDWKNSFKHDVLISKEFIEFHGQPVIMLINLSAGNKEEADELAYKIITTAVTLSQENIPAALAAYDHDDVRLTTNSLTMSQLISRSLEIAEQMVTFVNPTRYLNPPDVGKLRANLSRIRLVDSDAARELAQLLALEYQSLQLNARSNPATKALKEVFGKVDQQSNIIVISQRNHDIEALAFNEFSFEKKGNAVITV